MLLLKYLLFFLVDVLIIKLVSFCFDLVYLHLNSQSEASQQEKIPQLSKIQTRFPAVRLGESTEL